ncbi:Uu.00g054010.m01.CDS01 [Anthostomella pinea]|uniref:Uu.00g054010.m01.CDS01 n=1 Tax=Anthostomella pinea TaxID=933095 RepID=A0AAI8VQU6_9PEZI|nr:Uu.00g054010.m01.CDS01 [Anthostomella pinea]
MPTNGTQPIPHPNSTARYGIFDEKQGHVLSDLPSECRFQNLIIGFWYYALPASGGHTACLGGPHYDFPGWYCSETSFWPPAYIDSMVAAVTEQTTKDGQFEASGNGHWTVNFDWFTTAIPDRGFTAQAFEDLVRNHLQRCDEAPYSCWRQQTKYWYRADGQEMYLTYDIGGWLAGDFCPPL